ncbi:ABC transporter ATP-binding protein, partial [Vibrio sp. 10N.261.45.A4]
LNDYYKWLTEQQKEIKKAQSKEVVKSSVNSASAKKDQKRKEAEFRKLTAPIRKNITALEKKMDKLNNVLELCEEQLGDTELYQAENKSKLTQVLGQQASAKSELEDVEMEWMTEQESL